MIAKLIIRDLAEFRRSLVDADKKVQKAALISARVEAYRLRTVLKDELRAGAPGGRIMPPLRVITTSGRKRKPLARLAKAVRYWQGGSDDRKIISVGFNDGTVAALSGRISKGNQLSRSWVRIVTSQQEGFSVDPDAPTSIGSSIRRLWRRIGSNAPKKVRKFYFLRKSTTSLRVPARPIIDPFWQRHQVEAGRNIVANFNRKLSGERI